MKELDSEELYQILKERNKNQKESIEKLKNLDFQDYAYTQEDIHFAKKFITLDQGNLHEWLSTEFESDLNEKNILSPEIKGRWGITALPKKKSGIDITNRIFLSYENINYKIVNNTIKSTVILSGESEYWLFLHTNGNFNDETVAILFSKKEFSEIVFMSLGLFVKKDTIDVEGHIEDNSDRINDNRKSVNNEYFFRIIRSVQLVKTYNIRENSNNKYESQDSCLIKLLISDEGNEKIKISAWMNEGDAENELVGNFYKQVAVKDFNDNLIKSPSSFELNEKNHKVMIAGSGHQCKVIHFSCETNFKENFEYIGCKQGFNSCNCCLFF